MYKQMKAKQSPVTVEVINGVQIQGQSKQIGTSDESKPITEQYLFKARDLNGDSLSSDKVFNDISKDEPSVPDKKPSNGGGSSSSIM